MQEGIGGEQEMFNLISFYPYNYKSLGWKRQKAP
jgi:hypothetical protein